METTKLIVEYLIAGILICLATLFLVFNISPAEIESASLVLLQMPSFASAGLLIIILPMAYALGMIGEYLGMTIYESLFDKIMKRRFPIFVEQNNNWLTKTSLFKYDRDRKYNEMRFFIIMKSPALYSEIERYLNQLRILRVLTIIEFLFLLGLFFHIIKNGMSLLPTSIFIVFILMLVLNIRAISHRISRYCEALENSFKVLSLNDMPKRSSKE